MNKIIFLVSGGGGTLKFLHYAIDQFNLNIEICGVIGDRDCSALEFAQKNKLFNKKIKYNKDNTTELQTLLKELHPDLIVTNIHKIIDINTINKYPGKYINLHYSLLPSFSGLIGMETVNKAKEQNVGFIGGTCHFVNEHVDAGKIIQQGCFAVDWVHDENIIDTLFKTSCISLLNAVMKIFNISTGKQTQIDINDKVVFFSPDLQFNFSFNQTFWNKINKDN